MGDGPNYMLFDPALTAIDTRYPALAEGALWPDLLRLYAPVSHAGSVLVLKRQDGKAPHDLLGPAAAATVRFGEPLAIQSGEPPSSGSIWKRRLSESWRASCSGHPWFRCA